MLYIYLLLILLDDHHYVTDDHPLNLNNFNDKQYLTHLNK